MHGSSQLRSASERRAEFVEPMECALVSKLSEGPDSTYEAKVDGYYVVGAKAESGSQRRDIAKAENRGKRFRSSSETESLRIRIAGSARFGTQSTNGSKASCNIAAYFLRS